MADPWELILHHTYRGAPGLVYDCSPRQGSHGVAVGAVKFHPDGADPTSASISFPNRWSYVHVNATKGWDQLVALRAEALCYTEWPQVYTVAQSIIRCSLFRWFLYQITVKGEPKLGSAVALGGTTTPRIVVLARVPLRRWATLAFQFNGWDRLEFSVDGDVVSSVTAPVGPLPGASPLPLDIGGFAGGWGRYESRIDDVKVWRRNPLALSQDFLSRPMDNGTAQCWARWGRRLRDWLQAHPRCAAELAGQLGPLYQAVYEIDADPELRTQFRTIGETYRREWTAGTLTSEEMIRAGADAARLLDRAGYPTEVVNVLLNESDCWRRLMTDVPAPECDHQFTELIRATARELGEGRRSWPERR
jgi:hypothetical protein